MNPNPPNDDLLSAFHDRKRLFRARNRLAKADATGLRQELNDFRRISEILRVLPQETHRPESLLAVMQRAEREMLIPMAAAAAPEELRIAKARGWWIGVAATAAVVLIAVVATPFVRWKPATARR